MVRSDEAPDRVTGGALLTNRPDYTRTYNGLELTLNKRLADKWFGRMAFSLMNWTELKRLFQRQTDSTGSPAIIASQRLSSGSTSRNTALNPGRSWMVWVTHCPRAQSALQARAKITKRDLVEKLIRDCVW